MIIKKGVIIAGLDIKMRQVLITAERIYKEYGRKEGVTITSGLDGCHSAGSYHPYGYALDFRTHYFGQETQKEVAGMIRRYLKDIDPAYDVVLESDHLHCEYDIEKANSNKPKKFLDSWRKK